MSDSCESLEARLEAFFSLEGFFEGEQCRYSFVLDVRGWLARKRVAYMKGEETRKPELIEERRERSAVRIQARK